jgi:predicted AlkP superfamily phosphohydrolase/phosphomutase
VTRQRVLAIGLDGFDLGYASGLMAEGRLPVLTARGKHDAHVLLDAGREQRTGLSWEHFWSGLDPIAAHRDCGVTFDPAHYSAWQEGARFPPFFGPLDIEAVVFDAPYADLARAPRVQGVVAWGTHDPGLSSTASAPDSLLEELRAAVGSYPAPQWIYGVPWPSVASTREMGEGLVAGVEARARAASWLLRDRISDWDLALVVVGETHAAAEAFWHGVDPAHPLHSHPSAPAAAEALRNLYEAVDRFVGATIDAVDPAVVILFSMGGMGPNRSDTQSMVLLPELVFRWATGERALEPPAEWTAVPGALPDPGGDRVAWQRDWYPSLQPDEPRVDVRRAVNLLPSSARRWVQSTRSARRARSRPSGFQDLAWQPAKWYQPRWPEMRAFAMPTFYDGRIRVNLRGREATGIVDPADYTQVCDELEALVRDCVDPRTGESVVALVERIEPGRDPLTLDGEEADIALVWSSSTAAFDHPVHGLIGPVPFRRTGGHTSPYGFASLVAPNVIPGDYGVGSSFDVAPTIVELLGAPPLEGMSGTSLQHRWEGASPRV